MGIWIYSSLRDFCMRWNAFHLTIVSDQWLPLKTSSTSFSYLGTGLPSTKFFYFVQNCLGSTPFVIVIRILNEWQMNDLLAFTWRKRFPSPRRESNPQLSDDRRDALTNELQRLPTKWPFVRSMLLISGRRAFARNVAKLDFYILDSI